MLKKFKALENLNEEIIYCDDTNYPIFLKEFLDSEKGKAFFVDRPFERRDKSNYCYILMISKFKIFESAWIVNSIRISVNDTDLILKYGKDDTETSYYYKGILYNAGYSLTHFCAIHPYKEHPLFEGESFEILKENFKKELEENFKKELFEKYPNLEAIPLELIPQIENEKDFMEHSVEKVIRGEEPQYYLNLLNYVEDVLGWSIYYLVKPKEALEEYIASLDKNIYVKRLASFYQELKYYNDAEANNLSVEDKLKIAFNKMINANLDKKNLNIKFVGKNNQLYYKAENVYKVDIEGKIINASIERDFLKNIDYVSGYYLNKLEFEGLNKVDFSYGFKKSDIIQRVYFEDILEVSFRKRTLYSREEELKKL